MVRISLMLFVLGLISGAWGQPAASKVLVSLYAESLCPDCIEFTQDPLNQAFSEVRLRVMQLQSNYEFKVLSYQISIQSKC